MGVKCHWIDPVLLAKKSATLTCYCFKARKVFYSALAKNEHAVLEYNYNLLVVYFISKGH